MDPIALVEPELWQEFLDARTNKTYYHNRFANVTLWERPTVSLHSSRVLRESELLYALDSTACFPSSILSL